MISIALAALVATTQPQTPQRSATEICTEVGKLAESVITAYYVGVPLSDMLKIDDTTPVIKMIIMDAYDEPRFSGAEYIAEAQFDFRNRWERGCYAALSETAAN